MGSASSKPKAAPADAIDDDLSTRASMAAPAPPPPAALPPGATSAPPAPPPPPPDSSASSVSSAAALPRSSGGMTRFFGRRSSAPAPPAASLDGGDGRVARMTVREVAGREELEQARREEESADYNQTGQTAYEIAALAKYQSVPERERPPREAAMYEEDRERRLSVKTKKNERRESRAAKKHERDVRKGKVAPPTVLQKGTVEFALADARRLGVLNLGKMQLGSVPDSVFEGLDGTTRVITISGNNLRSIDTRFTEFVLVQRLVAANNLITSIPPVISRMTALRKLDLANNKLATVPDSFANMPHLEHVDLSGNGLTSLPDSFASLNLLSLRLTGNNFTAPPRVVEAMRSLQELYLDENRLVAIPPSWGALTQLFSLALDVNNIADFPDEILANCHSLYNLSVRANPLTARHLESKPSWGDFNSRRLNFHKYRLDSKAVTIEDLAVTDS